MEPQYKKPETHIQKTTAEIIHPRNLPEVAFQSYEALKNNASIHKEAFLAGDFRNPELEYSRFDREKMDQGIANLHEAIRQVREVEPNEEKADFVATTLEFRIAEMEYIKLLDELNRAVKTDESEERLEDMALRARSLSEQLYGVADEAVLNAARAEVWRQLDGKRLSPSAQKLYDELRYGFEWNGAKVAPLPRSEGAENLPDFNHPSLAWAGELVLADTAQIENYFREFWDEKVVEYGEDWIAYPDDIVEAFEDALRLLDPESTSGIGAEIDPEATALSWSSSDMAIKVGGKRKPINSSEDLYKKFLHEGVIHGGRAIEGLKTGLPVLGTGLFTNTPRADYLTFEEGLATTIEEAVSNTAPQWSGANLGYYLNIAQAGEGADFRGVFEIVWRYRLLMKVDNDEVIDEAMIAAEMDDAYGAVVRIYKGAPLRLQEKYPDILLPTYNKDLAYLRGRVLATRHIKELFEHNDEEGFRRMFKAKYDPTIPEQAAIVQQYV